jgi:PTS system cellobiose-specific IIC component
MSLMAPFFIGMALAEERKVDPMAAGLLSVAAFMTVTPYSVGEAYAVGANWLGGANIISGMIIGLLVAEMFTFVIRRNWVITLPDSVPASVSRSFSALIPGFLILSVFGIISWLLANHGSNFHQIIMDSISRPLASMGSVVGWAYVIFNSLLWFFGVHGSLALTALDNGIMTRGRWKTSRCTTSTVPLKPLSLRAKSSTSGPSRCWTPTSCWVVPGPRSV